MGSRSALHNLQNRPTRAADHLEEVFTKAHTSQETAPCSLWREIVVSNFFSITSIGLFVVLVLKFDSTTRGSRNVHGGFLLTKPNAFTAIKTTVGKTVARTPVTSYWPG